MASRLLTINIRNYLVKQPRRKRPARMSRYVRYKIARAVKMRLKDVKLTGELNSIMLKRYLHSMMPLKVNINVEKDKATAMPFGEKPKPSAASAAAPKAKVSEGVAKEPATVQKEEAKAGPTVQKTDAKDSKKS